MMRELALERNGMMDHRKFIIDTMSVILMRSRFYHLPRQNHWLLKFLGKGSLWYNWYLITLAKRWGGSQRRASRYGQAKLKVFLASFDHRRECLHGNSCCHCRLASLEPRTHANIVTVNLATEGSQEPRLTRSEKP